MEHIVIDGGSTDGSLPILQAHGAQLAALVSEPDKGIYDALNKGIRRATGDVVGFLHADDLYETPESLAQVAAAFDDPAVDAVYGDLVYVRNDDPSQVVRYWRAGQFVPGCLERGWMPPHPTFYVRRSVYERLGLFETKFRIAADYESILRILGRRRGEAGLSAARTGPHAPGRCQQPVSGQHDPEIAGRLCSHAGSTALAASTRCCARI